VAWMQSTGHTSTHEASLTPMQGSVITYVTAGRWYTAHRAASAADRA
jgi:hypothetical protein